MNQAFWTSALIWYGRQCLVNWITWEDGRGSEKETCYNKINREHLKIKTGKRQHLKTMKKQNEYLKKKREKLQKKIGIANIKQNTVKLENVT